MAKDPAFLFYFSDFLTSTDLMTGEELGCYIRILCHMADKGRLKKEHILSICRAYPFTYALQDHLKIDDNGLYYHPRLELEVEKRKNYTQSRRDNAKHMHEHMEDRNRDRNRDVVKKDRIVKERIPKDKYLTFVHLTPEEYSKLVTRFTEEGTKERIYKLNNYIGSKGDKYKSHYHTILNWETLNGRK